MSEAKPAKKAPRAHHVVARMNQEPGEGGYDEIVVFGTELEALRHIVGKADWVYAQLANGQQFSEADGR